MNERTIAATRGAEGAYVRLELRQKGQARQCTSGKRKKKKHQEPTAVLRSGNGKEGERAGQGRRVFGMEKKKRTIWKRGGNTIKGAAKLRTSKEI